MAIAALWFAVLMPGAQAQTEAFRDVIGYDELAEVLDRFERVPPGKREGMQLVLRVRLQSLADDPAGQGPVTFEADGARFGLDAFGDLDLPEGHATRLRGVMIAANRPSDVLFWFSPQGVMERGADPTGEEARRFAKAFGRAAKRGAGAMRLFMPSPKGVAVRDADGEGTVTLVEGGVRAERALEGPGLVLTYDALRGVDRIELADDQRVEAYYETNMFLISDIDMATKRAREGSE